MQAIGKHKPLRRLRKEGSSLLSTLSVSLRLFDLFQGLACRIFYLFRLVSTPDHRVQCRFRSENHVLRHSLERLGRLESDAFRWMLQRVGQEVGSDDVLGVRVCYIVNDAIPGLIVHRPGQKFFKGGC